MKQTFFVEKEQQRKRMRKSVNKWVKFSMSIDKINQSKKRKTREKGEQEAIKPIKKTKQIG